MVVPDDDTDARRYPPGIATSTTTTVMNLRASGVVSIHMAICFGGARNDDGRS